MEYNFTELEKKWQAYWAKNKTFKAADVSDKPKYYVLDMFPYPSGAGLHVGHPLGYIASDIIARYKRHKGFNVLHPMGYDSFGLPAEQYAIQTGQHPSRTTYINIDGCLDDDGKIKLEFLNTDGSLKKEALNNENQIIQGYRRQLDKIGFSFDWDREVRTSDSEYYKWTQWIFIQIFNSWYNKTADKAEEISTLIKAFETNGNTIVNAVCDEDTPSFTAQQWKAYSEKEQSDILMKYRLAYLGEAYVNWCPALGTVLANDEVKDGVSERGGHPVERKLMKQWSMRITAYAQRLLDGLETIDWTESLKESQRNWIGRSEGTSLKFDVFQPSIINPQSSIVNHQSSIVNHQSSIEVFTTRPDTVFGVSFVTLAPEHELVEALTTPEQKKEVEAYVTQAKNRSERERQADINKITGVFTGSYAVHPFSGKQLPIWIGDYVLAGYGTGAVMAVPAHDSRDYSFAKHFNLPIIEVVAGGDINKESYEAKEGKIINSDFLNGLDVKDAIKVAIKEIEKRSLGKGKTNYRLRDAVFGRQRYWGEPIPIYYKNGIPYALPENELPLVLPDVDKYLPTEDGEPPLARAKDWKYKPLSNSPLRGEDKTKPRWQTAANSGWAEMKERARQLRNNQTDAESVLWQNIKNNQLGFKFRRQQVIGFNIVDFVCLDKKLIIEVDGEIHNYQKEYDDARTSELEKEGYKVIRFENRRVFSDIENVLSEIRHQLQVLPQGEDLGGASYAYEHSTMPGWAGSSWYFLRYMDAKNSKQFVSKQLADYWQQIDLYIGGSEHATGHLLYVRFWTKFLKDLSYINIEEPAKKLINQGMIQGVSLFISKNKYVTKEDQNDEIELFATNDIVSRFDKDNNPISIRKNNKTYFFKSYNEWRIPVQYTNGISKLYWDDIFNLLRDPYFSSMFPDLNQNNIDEKFLFRNDMTGEFIFARRENNSQISETLLSLRTEVEKMSKSKLNVITPDLICEKFGADTLRLYEMFLGPLEQSKPWNTNGITGVSGFLKKLWKLAQQVIEADKALSPLERARSEASKAELKTLHKTIKKITEDIERFSFNTSVSNFMICVNELSDLKCNKRAILEPLLILISPYAPHITEELWEQLGHTESITFAEFPMCNESYLVDDAFNYPISFNGKTRLQLEFPASFSIQQIEQEVMAREDVQKYLEGKTPKKIIIVPKKIVNIVV